MTKLTRNFIFGILALSLCATMLLPYSLAFWGTGVTGNSATHQVSVDTDFDYNDPYEILEGQIPEYLGDRLDDIHNDPSLSDQAKDQLANIVGSIVNYPPFAGGEIPVLIGGTLEDIFASYNPPFDFECFLVFIDADGELMMIHIRSGTNAMTAADLLARLSEHWSDVELASNVWVAFNNYTTFDAPLEYDDGMYLMYHDGPRGTPPPQDPNTWFRVPTDMVWVPQRVYFTGWIVLHQGVYYIASSAVWGNTAPGSGGWTIIPAWTDSASYATGTVVRMAVGDQMCFFRALAPSNGVPPTTQNCADGFWQQITNGWIGRSGAQTIFGFYFSHNTYAAGQIVIYGISPKNKYIYYQAKVDVPANQPPHILDNDGFVVVNDTYWVRYT